MYEVARFLGYFGPFTVTGTPSRNSTWVPVGQVAPSSASTTANNAVNLGGTDDGQVNTGAPVPLPPQGEIAATVDAQEEETNGDGSEVERQDSMECGDDDEPGDLNEGQGRYNLRRNPKSNQRTGVRFPPKKVRVN